jgi:cytochrome c
MVTLALAPEFWVAYDAQNCGLYKVWRDGTKLEGAVYTNAHGPQPTSVGPAWLISKYDNPWRLHTTSGKQTPRPIYRGHRIENGQAVLEYDLELSDGHLIHVKESPERVENANGMPGLERRFVVEGVPEGATLELKTPVQSILAERFLETNGEFEFAERGSRAVNWIYHLEGEGWLQFKGNGTTFLTLYFAREPGVFEAIAEEAEELASEQVHPGLALINGSDCRTCHNEQVQTVGPSYQAIAEKYPNTPGKVKELARKVMNGGSGVWGEAMMSAHPDLMQEDAETMVQYIMSLDADTEEPISDPIFSEVPRTIDYTEEGRAKTSGLAVKVYLFPAGELNSLPEIPAGREPDYGGVSSEVLLVDNSFAPLEHDFVMHLTGYITVDRNTKYDFRLMSDDGSRLSIDGQEVINNDGLHGAWPPQDGEINLTAGKHRVELEYFERSGGRALIWAWLPHGGDFFKLVPAEILSHDAADLQNVPIFVAKETKVVAGDSTALTGVHPSFSLSQARPTNFLKKVGGLDFLGDKLLVSTWDPAGDVYLLDGVTGDDPESIRVTRIATGLAEPLGLKVVDDKIYVLQKQELTQLIDHDGDMIADEYKTVCNGWKVSANFHEFAFGLAEQDGFLYATLATAIMPGGASANPQIPDRGKVIKINPETGDYEFIAHGLRTPNGVGHGVDNELYVADNQGDWLPSSKIVHVQEGAWYGSRSVDFEGTAGLTETKPVVWLPQDEIGNSPSQPTPLNVGPYQNQMLHGEVTHGGLKRVFAEKVEGQYQGALFRFSQGFEAGVNRVVWGPDGALYVGGVGSTGNWRHMGGKPNNLYGLQKIKYNGKTTFEMLAVRALSNGFEIEFTEPLAADMAADDPASYQVKMWYYLPTAEYGGPKLDERFLNIRKLTVSPDRKKVLVELDGLQEDHVVYFHLDYDAFRSENGQKLWSTEAWYTLNRIPRGM